MIIKKNKPDRKKEMAFDYEKFEQEAISKLAINIINTCIKKPWKTYILTHDVNGITISGGKSQDFKM